MPPICVVKKVTNIDFNKASNLTAFQKYFLKDILQ